MERNIFVYGSLMCPQSCQRTLGRIVDYIPAQLKNYQRVFNAVGNVYSDILKDTTSVKFANLQFMPNSATCHGLIIKVTQEELDKLCAREYLYDLVDISEHIEEIEKVFTFISVSPGNPKAVVLKRYLELIENAIENYPILLSQVKQEINALNPDNILSGGFLSVSGHYMENK